MKKKILGFTLFFIFFIAEFIFLYWESAKNWFWTDESFTLLGLAANLGWRDYLLGNTAEGSTAPLFFLLSKTWLAFSSLWHYLGNDPTWIYRWTAIIPISLSFAWIARDIYKFAFNKYLGVLLSIVLFIALNTSTLAIDLAWQARPYGLWFFFSYFFWSECLLREGRRKRMLFIAATALALTTPFALFEIGIYWIVSMTKYFTIKEQKTIKWQNFWKKNISEYFKNHLTPCLLAMGIAFFYSSRVPAYSYVWPGFLGFFPLLLAHAKVWIYIPLIVGLVLFWQDNRWKIVAACSFLLAQILILILVITVFYHHRGPGFEISHRYFLFLFPQSIALLLFIFSQIQNQRFHLIFSTLLLAILSAIAVARFPHVSGADQVNFAAVKGLRQDLASMESLSSRLCFCHFIQDGLERDINSWGIGIFVLREWNQAHQPCDAIIPMHFIAHGERHLGIEILDRPVTEGCNFYFRP